MKQRSFWQKLKDFLTFPLRAVAVFYEDRWGLSALSSERYYYVSREVTGYCLDVGCGPDNRFISEFLDGRGAGVDVFKYPGLKDEQIVSNILHFPFPEQSFSTITFIANFNHIPKHNRLPELDEALRCLKKNGNIIITMGNPIAEVLAHSAIWLYDKIFKTRHDVDTVRGMEQEESYYVTDSEIINSLRQIGFVEIKKKYFFTQWGLNHLFVGWKK